MDSLMYHILHKAMQIEKKFYKLISATLIASLVVVFFNFPLGKADAASLTAIKDTMSRLEMSTLSNHTISFTFSAGTAVIQDETITITFPADFSLVGIDCGDVDITDDGADEDVQEVAGSCTPSATEWGAAVSGQVLTLTAPSGGATYINGSSVVIVEIGTNATADEAGDEQITNATTAGSKTISIGGNFGDTGSLAVGIADDDQVTITATVDPTLTFDIDTATTDTTSDPLYSVALGTITTANSKASGTTDSVNYIWLDLNTNATGGAIVTVMNANGANGLVSTSVAADDIDSVTGTIANGTENYGICVTATSASIGSFTEVAPFNDADCAADDQTPTVGGFDGTSQNLLNTGSAGISAGRAQITVAAAISGVTDAHNDYTDTLTFIATGTF